MRKDKRYEFYKNRYSHEIADYFKENGYITWEMYVSNKKICGTIGVLFVCQVCQAPVTKTAKELRKRKYQSSTCNNCVLKYTTNLQEWKQKNSESQKKIQSTAEQKLKNSEAVTKFWSDNPEKLITMKNTLLKKYQDDSFKNEWLKTLKKQTFALSGKYIYDNGTEIFFGSSYELCFLHFCEYNRQNWNIKNLDLNIKYFYNGRSRHYRPDFLLEEDCKKILIEIKSSENVFFDKDKQAAKLNGVRQLLSDGTFQEYWFVDEQHELADLIMFKRSKKIKPLCKKLFAENKLVLTNYKHIKEYIGV
jgi:hypothetical protein